MKSFDLKTELSNTLQWVVEGHPIQYNRIYKVSKHLRALACGCTRTYKQANLSAWNVWMEEDLFFHLNCPNNQIIFRKVQLIKAGASFVPASNDYNDSRKVGKLNCGKKGRIIIRESARIIKSTH